jgi:hypothetical protein
MFKNAAAGKKEDYRQFLTGCRLPLEEAVYEGLKVYAEDSDSQVRERAKAILGWERNRRQKEARKILGRAVSPALLLGTSLLSAFLGFLLFLWAFRLLKLRALLGSLGISRSRSIALGTVAMTGEAQPVNGYLEHPLTGERCLYYHGAERSHPDHRFYVEDETGRVEVDPRGAVLLSEDGVVSPGERIHIVATAGKNPKAGATSDEPRRALLHKSSQPKPLYQRIADFLVGGLLGFGARRRSTRRLFTDPRDVFWIWDDARRKPMSSPRDVAFLFAVALFGGAWILVFFVSTLSVLGVELDSLVSQFASFVGT